MPNHQNTSAKPPLCEPLENRQLLTALSTVTPITKAIKVQNLFGSNGVSLNQSLISIPFTSTIKIHHGAGIKVRGYAIDPVVFAQKKLVIHLLDAPRVGGKNGNYLVLHTDRLMRKKGGRFLIDLSALRDSLNRDLPQMSIICPKGQNKERFTLASRAFKATDHNLFRSDVFADTSADTDVSSPIPEGTVTAALTSFLSKKVTAGFINSAEMTTALAEYNDTRIKNIIPDANLRAAMVSLHGTVGEPAIGAMLNGNNETGKAWTIIGFSSSVSPTAEIAETVRVVSTNRLRTLFGLKYQGEPFQALSAKLAHESLHQDTTDGVPEEEFANITENLVYAQQLLVDHTTGASIVGANTEVTKYFNTKLYAMIESGRQLFPRVGTLQGPILGGTTSGIFPGAATPTDSMGVYTSFDNFIRRLHLARGFGDTTSTGNSMVTAIMTQITGTPPASTTFNSTLVSQVDRSQTAISDRGAIELARLLKLTV